MCLRDLHGRWRGWCPIEQVSYELDCFAWRSHAGLESQPSGLFAYTDIGGHQEIDGIPGQRCYQLVVNPIVALVLACPELLAQGIGQRGRVRQCWVLLQEQRPEFAPFVVAVSVNVDLLSWMYIHLMAASHDQPGEFGVCGVFDLCEPGRLQRNEDVRV